MHDLLNDPLIGVRTPQGERRVNLPELLAGLSANEVEGYTGLRAHQADPWHVFLVQLAASIQARRPTETLPTDPSYWRDGLLDLADGMASAWHLVVEDVTKPAFMQHPKNQEVNYKAEAISPDEIDVLFLSRNHDIKRARMTSQNPEGWIYALVTRQTVTPYRGGGGKLNGIARMNSGSGSRPIVAWVRDLHPSKRFIDETTKLRSLRHKVLAAGFNLKDRGIVLTWIKPWNCNEHQFYLKDLEPWFIEAALLVRLQLHDDKIIALQGVTAERQIGPKTPHSGDVGDPWIPITSDGKAITISHPGFTPEILCRLLFKQKIENTPNLLEPDSTDDCAWLVGSVLISGGNCKTSGFSHVELPVPPRIRPLLLHREHRVTLGHLAEKLLKDAQKIQQMLSNSLNMLFFWEFQRLLGPDKRLDRDLSELLQAMKKHKHFLDRVKPFIESINTGFVKRWELSYFPTLWRGAEEEHDAVRADWQQQLVNAAQELLDEATERLPLPANRTWRAITQAQRAFIGMLRKSGLPLPTRTPSQPPEILEETLA